MPVPFSAKLSKNESVLVQTLDDGEAILLDLDNEIYFGLNESGVVMWQELMQSASVDKALNSLVDIFPETDPATIERDLIEFVDELVSQKLVQVDPSPSDE